MQTVNADSLVQEDLQCDQVAAVFVFHVCRKTHVQGSLQLHGLYASSCGVCRLVLSGQPCRAKGQTMRNVAHNSHHSHVGRQGSSASRDHTATQAGTLSNQGRTVMPYIAGADFSPNTFQDLP